jgi:hypothetical protein
MGATPTTSVITVTGQANCSSYSQDAFSAPWRCSGQLYSEEVQTLAKDYYIAANTILEALFAKVYTNEIYGKDCMEYYDRMMDIHYLFFYMMIIYNKRKEDEVLDPDTFETNEYYTTYDIECIRKRFKCKGIEIYPLLQVFSIETLSAAFDTFGGVGYDIITDNGETNIGDFFNEVEVY